MLLLVSYSYEICRSTVITAALNLSLLVISDKDVNNNEQSDYHEGWLFQVNKTITTSK